MVTLAKRMFVTKRSLLLTATAALVVACRAPARTAPPPNSGAPVASVAPPNAIVEAARQRLAVGDDFERAVRANGDVWCWGDNVVCAGDPSGRP